MILPIFAIERNKRFMFILSKEVLHYLIFIPIETNVGINKFDIILVRPDFLKVENLTCHKDVRDEIVKDKTPAGWYNTETREFKLEGEKTIII